MASETMITAASAGMREIVRTAFRKSPSRFSMNGSPRSAAIVFFHRLDAAKLQHGLAPCLDG